MNARQVMGRGPPSGVSVTWLPSPPPRNKSPARTGLGRRAPGRPRPALTLCGVQATKPKRPLAWRLRLPASWAPGAAPSPFSAAHRKPLSPPGTRRFSALHPNIPDHSAPLPRAPAKRLSGAESPRGGSRKKAVSWEDRRGRGSPFRGGLGVDDFYFLCILLSCPIFPPKCCVLLVPVQLRFPTGGSRSLRVLSSCVSTGCQWVPGPILSASSRFNSS